MKYPYADISILGALVDFSRLLTFWPLYLGESMLTVFIIRGSIKKRILLLYYLI